MSFITGVIIAMFAISLLGLIWYGMRQDYHVQIVYSTLAIILFGVLMLKAIAEMIGYDI